MEPRPAECTCLPLNRRLMAHLLKVDEGSVHEQGCVDRVRASLDSDRLAAAMRGVLDTTTRTRILPYLDKIAAEYARLAIEGLRR